MTKNDKFLILEDRLTKLQNNPKDAKCPGVIRKLTRQVRNLSKEIESSQED